NSTLVSIYLDYWTCIILLSFWLTLLRLVCGAKLLVVRIRLLILQDAGMRNALACRVLLLRHSNDGIERNSGHPVLFALLYQRIHGTFDEIECALALRFVHGSIEPGRSMTHRRLMHRFQS